MIDRITTIEDLAQMIQRTMASKEDLKAFATKVDLDEMRGDISEMRGDINGIKGGMNEMREEIGNLQKDVSYIRTTMNALVSNDLAQDGAIEELRDRTSRLEFKAGFAPA